ncbi:hypothetical protein J2128_000352 [Methanomicrobium sp. W14]|nr:hypothetical protein [Methanomicrobium sp. W14]
MDRNSSVWDNTFDNPPPPGGEAPAWGASYCDKPLRG